MMKGVLKFWRFFSPAFIIVFYFGLLGKFTGIWDITFPTNLKELVPTIPILVLAVIYYALGIANLANKFWFSSVTENLRKRLVSASDLNDQPNIFKWKEIRGVFYHLIDNDKSLTTKGQLAHFNGLIWTTAADSSLISAVFICAALVMYLLGVPNTLFSALFFFVICIISIMISWGTTLKHKSIGNQQVEIIEHLHKEKLTAKLKAIDKKFRNRSS